MKLKRYYALTGKCLVVLLALFSSYNTTNAVPLTGTLNIPGDYPTLAAAITDLNTQGVGVGGVTLNLVAGNPQTAPTGGYIIGGTGTAILTTTAVGNQVIIQGNGNTITAPTPQTSGGFLLDAIFKIVGADFITIDNFTMLENAANTTTTAGSNNMTEWGVAILYQAVTNGSQDITIKNCTIDLNRTYQNTFGIYSSSVHSTTSATTAASATGAAGGNHRLTIINNNISDVNIGISVVGPLAAADQNDGLTIGGTISTANTISNYGTTGTFSGFSNVSGSVNGVHVKNVKNFNISFNSITSSNGGTTSGTLRGIYIFDFNADPTGTITNTLNNNSISVVSGATSGAIAGITVDPGTGNATTTLNINNNDFNSCGHSVASSGTANMISNSMSTSLSVLNTNINNNTFTNLSFSTTGTVILIQNLALLIPDNGTYTVENNSIVGTLSRTGASGNLNLISSAGTTASATATEHVRFNNFSNITLSSASTITGIVNTNAADFPNGLHTRRVDNNTLSNWTGTTGSMTGFSSNRTSANCSFSNNTISNFSNQGSLAGISCADVLAARNGNPFNISGNTITNLSSTSTSTGSVYGISSSNQAPVVNYSGNIIRSLSSSTVTATGVTPTAGIHLTNTVVANVFKNTICDISNDNSANTNGVAGINIITGGATYSIHNNLIGDIKSPNGNQDNAVSGINIGSGPATVNVYYNTVNLNASSTGATFGSSAITGATGAVNLTMNNNVLVNNSVSNGSGRTVAFRVTATGVGLYNAASNRNDFYAPFIYSDGTNHYASLSGYKANISGRDANSVSENPNFLSTSCGNANFLRIDNSIATALESGGVNIGGITDDVDGNIRQGNGGYAGTGTAPDIGADEFEGTALTLCSSLASAGTISGPASICTGTGTTLSLTGAPLVSGLEYEWSSGSAPGGPYNTVLGASLVQATGTLISTTYYIVKVTCSNDGSTATTPEFELEVKPLPSVSVNPTSGSFCNPGGSAITITASGNSTSYSWSPENGLNNSTGATVVALPLSPHVYTVTGTLNGCTSTATTTITPLAGASVQSISVTPLNICANGSTQLNASVKCYPADLKITEWTHTRNTTGQTSPAPPYVNSQIDEYVEISNIGATGADLSGLTYEFWTGAGTVPTRSLTFPAGSYLDPNTVLVVGIGNGFGSDPANSFYVTGGGTVSSIFGSTAVGHIVKSGSTILDVLTMNNFSWPGASGVTGADWSGASLGGGSGPGVSRTAAIDNNNSSDWTANSGTFLQTLGTYNGGYTSTATCGFDYTWSPASLFVTSTGNPATASNIPSTTVFTVTATVSATGCTATGTATVFIEPLVCGALTTAGINECVGNKTVTAHPSAGGTPYSYAWTEDGNPVGGNTQTITTSAGTHNYVCVVTDACGVTCSSSASIVTELLPPVAISSATTFKCHPYESIDLTASGASTYSWLPVTGLSSNTGAIVNANPVRNTTYTVTGTDVNGCINTSTTTITVGYTPLDLTASAIPPAVCSGEASNLISGAYIPMTQTVDLYQFSTSDGVSLDPMVGATTILNSSNDNNVSGVTPIGFNFTYHGNDYTDFSVSPDGWILLGTTAAINDATNSVTDVTNVPKIYPYWDDIATGSTGNVKYLVTGTAPNRILIVQWFVVIPRVLSNAANSTFQAWLYESTNRIEFRYGAMGTPSGTSNISSGLSGSPSSFHCITFTTKTSSNSTAFNNNNITPAAGTLFAYAPQSETITYSWEPAGDVVNPNQQNTATNNLFATTVFTVTATNGSCSTSTTTTVFAGSPLVCSPATISSPHCANSEFTITANHSGGGAPFSYAWSDGSPTVYPASQSIPVTLAAGIYTFTCVVTDDCGSTCSSQLTFEVNGLPAISVTPPSGQSCKPGPVAVDFTASGASTYIWTPTTGLSVSTGANVSANPTFTTTYTVTGTDANGCVNSASVTMTVGNIPTVTATATPSTICANSTTQLNATGTVPNTVDLYAFSTSLGGTLDPMSGATTLIGGSPAVSGGFGDNDIQTPAPSPIGFDFEFEGLTYSAFSVSPDGFAKLGDIVPIPQPSNGPNLVVGFTQNVPKVYPFWDDICIGLDGHVKYLTVGSAPNRILIIEWFVTIPKNLAGNANSRYQAWLYESTNVVEFRYGTMGSGAGITASVGITQPGTASLKYNSVLVASNTNTTTSTTSSSVTPADGRIYRFTRPANATFSWQPAAGLTPNANVADPVTPPLTGTTVYTVTATQDGCSATATTTVTIEPLVCSAATTSSIHCPNTDFTVTAHHTGGGAPYSYSWSDGVGSIYNNASTITANLPAGTYNFVCTVTDDCGATCTSSITITVNPNPTIAISPTSAQICYPVSNPLTLTASGGSTYIWTPGTGLYSTTGTSVEAKPLLSTTYTVTGTDGNGCINTATSAITVGTTPFNVTASATPSTICPGTFSQLSSTAECMNSILITEFVLFKTGTGATNPYPPYITSGIDDFVEVSNISNSPVDISGYVFQVWQNTAVSQSLTVPSGTILPANGVMVIGLDAGVNSPSDFYFNTGGTTSYSTVSDIGFLIKNGSLILDAVLVNDYVWPVASGVNTGDWSGTGINVSGAGSTRTAATDNNVVSDWTNASGSNIQTLGTYNGFFTYSCAADFSWQPAAGLKPNSFVQNPETPGLLTTTVYTVTVTNNGCTTTATTTVTINPLTCSPATISGVQCAGKDVMITAHHSGGGAPFQYVWSDGIGNVYPNAQTITANLPAGTYDFECTVTDDCGNSCISSITVTIDAAPVVSVSPLSAHVCKPGNSPVNLTADGASTYTWSPVTGLNSTTGASVFALPNNSTVFTVIGTASNGCTNSASAEVTVGYYPINPVASANPPVICPGANVQLDVSAECNPPALLITEFSSFVTAPGATNPMPGYVSPAIADHIEISNISSAPYDASGLEFELWENNAVNRSRTLPQGTIIPSHGVLVIGIGTANDNPGSLYFTTGGAATNVTSSEDAGFLIKHNGVILDVFSHSNWVWPVASGVTASDWSGPAYEVFGNSAGAIRYLSTDHNDASDWRDADATHVMTLGTYDNIYSTSTNCNFTYSWEPSAGLSPGANVENPQAVGVNSSTTYTVTITDNGCSVTATASVIASIDDGDACTVDGCNTTSGTPTHTPVNVDDGDPCTADGCNSVTGVFHTPICNVTLNSCVMMEGFYLGGGLMTNRAFTCGSSTDPMDADQITIAAVECTGSGFVVVDQQTVFVKTDGSFTCTFGSAVVIGQPYYLRITNCGTTETWSAAPVVLSAVTSYSFCTNPANTFAGNVKPLDATYYGMFSGDVNQDGAIDGSDFLDMDPLIQNGEGCNDCNDLNGDGAVDGSDFLILDPNIQNGIGAALPSCP